ncbi:dermonecrotic toxin domain-containing protein [Pseudomonas orientalis]|uniref:Uncharacterized protein n=1 Tax=Pseudomonas orientalis TaxID=76758 RepID=A0A1H2GHD0_9PSED|nr:DUF6543 domain-containing protein [Pseudomonas orientalis]KRP60253.1 hypothetical protein TU82_25990 [Pseudomonas orientalis]SDU18909.1 hypothetical protein SAMN04490197_3654 [Pseudomonas orientalis]
MTTSGSTSQGDNQQDKLIALLLNVAPSFTETARELLRQSLQEQYPDLHIDPNNTLIGTPTWELSDDRIVAGQTHYQSLSTVLARQSVTWTPTLCLEGEHFLTRAPVVEPPVHLPVRIVEIANTINILAKVMPRAYEEQLVGFWNQSNGNGPRWHKLSSTLRDIWNVQHVDGWTEEDCALARSLFHSPDRAIRRVNDRFQSRAYLVDVELVRGTNTQHTDLVFNAVLVGQSQGQTRILSYSMDNGYEKFASMAQLGASLSAQLVGVAAYDRLEWRLHEPDDNYFDHLAFKLIALQLEGTRQVTVSYDTPATAISAPPDRMEQPHPDGPGLGWYQTALPHWLAEASTIDQASYSRHLKDLATLHRLNAGNTYRDGIPDIGQYALDRMKAEIIKDHPEAQHLALDKLRVRVENQIVWGLFPVPGQTETTTFSLDDLALQNLTGLPWGNTSLVTDARHSIPAWLTVDYVQTLITRIDIGTTYPALIRSKLVDDPVESARRKALYGQYLRVELPMLALQNKIRQQAGIDERGYRYVAAVMQTQSSDRYVDGQAIVMRRLSFVPQRRTTQDHDVVTHMYVIGPKRAEDGPCLLYLPLFEPVLTQFPSPANLLYAITQSPALRNAVVAWLPDSVRSDYTNYVFPSTLPSPWAVIDSVVEPDKLWIYSGPMSLGEEVLNGDLFNTLFDSNAGALIDLADRQSLSNVENRWNSLAKASWRLFNASSPFMNRAESTVAWFWQINDDVQAFSEAHEHGDQPAKWSVLTDVLLNLGMALALHATRRKSPCVEPARDQSQAPDTSTDAAETTLTFTVEQLPERESLAPPPEHTQPLNTTGAVKRTAASLAAALDRYKIAKPAALKDPISAPGVDQHLYRHEQRYYAQVGADWFEVALQDGGTVVIVDPAQSAPTGLSVIHNARGAWFVDSRISLRAESIQAQTRRAIDQAKIKSDELRVKLETFENAKKEAQRELSQAQRAMSEAPGTSAQAKRGAYLQKLDSQSTSYEKARQQLMTLSIFTPVKKFQEKLLGYLKAQLDLNQTGINEQLITFAPAITKVLDHLSSRVKPPKAEHLEDFRQLAEMSPPMIERLAYAQSRFTELESLSRAGMELIRSSRKNLRYNIDDLKALQISMARNLCLQPETLATDPGAWKMLGETIDYADIAVQTLRDTLKERSEARLDERIEALGSLVEQFKFIDERLEDVAQEFPERILAEPLASLREQLRGFSARASSELAPLHVEQESRRIRPTPPPSPPRPVKKFIHTRFNGTLAGDPRLTPLGLETDLVDIRSPLTGEVIATFHEKNPGEWVQHVEAQASATPRPVVTVDSSLGRGQQLLDALPAFQTSVTEQASDPSRTPTGIEYKLHQHARLLEQAVQDIDESLTQLNVTESTEHPAVAMRKQLEDAATGLYHQANERMQTMIKQQPPTMAGVEWLNKHNLISIKKTASRRRLKSSTKDYLDEYTLTDPTTRNVIWYAHFHYSSTVAFADRFLSARLKTPQEHTLGTAADDVSRLTAEQQIAFYRSTINLTQARQFFFPAKPE